MQELFPSGVVALALAALGVVVGVLLVPFAARRTVAQPLDIALEDEVTVLVGILSDLRRLPYMTSLTASDFAAGANGRIWAGLLDVCAEELSELSSEPTDRECAELGARLAERSGSFHSDLHDLLASGPRARATLSRLAALSGTSAHTQPSDSEVVEAGEVVLLTGTGRTRLTGTGLVVPGTDPDSIDPANPPMRRAHATPTRLRRVLAGAATGAGASVLYGLVVAAGLNGASAAVGVAALGALLAGTVVIALVDQDTFYVDLRTLIVTSAAAWLLAAVAVGLVGQWSRLVEGVVVVAVTAVIFELLNRVHRLLRGMDGQGFGDTLIIIATAGLPAAVAGNWALGFWSVMAAALTAVIGWTYGAIRGRKDRTTPMAFGPYLAAGWVLGWAAYVLMSSSFGAQWVGLQ